MNESDRQVSESLEADERLLPYLPALLQDLWALGFSPEPLLALLERCGLAGRRDRRMLDLGCGKGAALIRLAREFGWAGAGVDLVPEFIDEARRRALEHGVETQVRFDVADITRVAREAGAVDLILFGFDSDALGSLQDSLTTVAARLAAGGHIVLDSVWTRAAQSTSDMLPNEAETRAAVHAAGLVVVGEHLYDPDWVRAQNRANTEHIRRRADELGRRHPDKRGWFDDYVRRQEDECAQLEEQLVCVLLLLARRDVDVDTFE